jgi:multiple sugar transport system permease protein
MYHTSRASRLFQILPLVLLILGLTVFPTLFAYYISTRHVMLSDLSLGTFVGFQNYLDTLGDSVFFKAIGFSIGFALVTTLVESLLGMGIALWFNRKQLPGKGILLSVMLIPIMVSPALLGIMFRLMLNEFVGPITYYLKSIGLPGNRLLTPDFILLTLVLIDVAQWTPFTFLIIYSALQTVPKELYEAAVVDGASAVQNFRFITIPLIAPFLAITVLVRWIDSFKVFDMIQILTGGGPGTLTTSISIYIYKMAFYTGDIGRAAAASIILLVALSIPLGLALRSVRRQE